MTIRTPSGRPPSFASDTDEDQDRESATAFLFDEDEAESDSDSDSNSNNGDSFFSSAFVATEDRDIEAEFDEALSEEEDDLPLNNLF